MGDMIKSLTDLASDFLPSTTQRLANGSADPDSSSGTTSNNDSSGAGTNNNDGSDETPESSMSAFTPTGSAGSKLSTGLSSILGDSSPPASPTYFSPMDPSERRRSSGNVGNQSEEQLVLQYEEKKADLPASIAAYVQLLRQQIGDAEQTIALLKTSQENLLKRNNDLALLLSHNQKTVQEQEVSLRELRSSLSHSRHELMEEKRRSSMTDIQSDAAAAVAATNADNPYLSMAWRQSASTGGDEDSYLAPSAATIMKADVIEPPPAPIESLFKPTESERESQQEQEDTSTVESSADDATKQPQEAGETTATAVPVTKPKQGTIEKAKALQADERSDRLRKLVDDIFTSADVDDDGVLNHAELSRLCTIVNIEDDPDVFAKRFDGTAVDRLVWLVGLLSPECPPPSTRSIAASVWTAVQAETMEEVVKDVGKRGLLETELHRWYDILNLNKGPDTGSAQSENGSEDDESWMLGTDFAMDVSEIPKKYDVQQEEDDLGEGRAGHVKPAKAHETGEGCACKIILKSIQSAEETQRELSILRKLKGENGVAQVMDVYEGPKELYVMMELCEGGELYDMVLDKSEADTAFSEAESAILMRQVLSVIDHLHERHRIVHRDMKPENVLLRRKGDVSDICVIDFGFSRFFEPGQRLTTRVGTVYYTASEVWQERYDNKCDLFSLGVLMYVLLCSYPPFDGEDDNEILRKVMRGKFTFPEDDWDGISEEAKDLIRRLMSKYPRRRPTAGEALQHEWFQKFPQTSIAQLPPPPPTAAEAGQGTSPDALLEEDGEEEDE